MRKLSTSYIAAFVATIVTLFIAGACSQQPLSVSTCEAADPDEYGNIVHWCDDGSNWWIDSVTGYRYEMDADGNGARVDIEPVVTPTSTLDDSGDELTSNQAVDETSRNNSTQGDAQTTNTPDPTATATQEDKQTTDTLDPTATATQEDKQTTDILDPTATATHADIETIIDGILAELLNDAMTNRSDLEEELEADMSFLSDDEQALIGVGE